MKKIAVFNPYWNTFGGGERYVSAAIRYFLDQGHQVSVNWPENVSPEIQTRFGIDISQARFGKIQSTLGFDLVFWVSDGSLPTSFSKKTIIHFQFPFKDIGGKSFINQLKAKLYVFVVNSDFTKLAIDKEFKIHSHILYPPVDTQAFVPKHKDNLIFYIGRFSNLTQQKGHATLISSFARISKKLPGWKLVLAGGVGVGTTEKAIHTLTDQAKGLPIEFLFNPSFTEITNLCGRGKFYWSASGFMADQENLLKQEHFGITVVEAMAAGAVPLITNLGGHREIVDNDLNGYLWDDPKQLERLTLELSRHASKVDALSQSAIKKSKLFDTNVFNATLERLL